MPRNRKLKQNEWVYTFEDDEDIPPKLVSKYGSDALRRYERAMDGWLRGRDVAGGTVTEFAMYPALACVFVQFPKGVTPADELPRDLAKLFDEATKEIGGPMYRRLFRWRRRRKSPIVWFSLIKASQLRAQQRKAKKADPEYYTYY